MELQSVNSTLQDQIKKLNTTIDSNQTEILSAQEKEQSLVAEIQAFKQRLHVKVICSVNLHSHSHDV